MRRGFSRTSGFQCELARPGTKCFKQSSTRDSEATPFRLFLDGVDFVVAGPVGEPPLHRPRKELARTRRLIEDADHGLLPANRRDTLLARRNNCHGSLGAIQREPKTRDGRTGWMAARLEDARLRALASMEARGGHPRRGPRRRPPSGCARGERGGLKGDSR